MLNNENKEVYFQLYCSQCKDKDTPETEDPCNDCLAHPSNQWSHKPLYFKEKDNAKED